MGPGPALASRLAMRLQSRLSLGPGAGRESSGEQPAAPEMSRNGKIGAERGLDDRILGPLT